MPTLDELEGLYASSPDEDKIDLTSNFIWTLETRGSDAAGFNFYDGKRDWSPQSFSGNTRVLPVRSGK